MPTDMDKRVGGLYVNDALSRLCNRWGTEVVLDAVRAWVAYMDKQIATMTKHFDGGQDG